MKELPCTNFAFEVDLEKMEGRFLFDTGVADQDTAERVLMERCDYKYMVIGCSCSSHSYVGGVKLHSSRVLGLSTEGAILPMGDTITTQLATEKGFICQLMPCYGWVDAVYRDKSAYVMTMANVYPIKIMNSPFDV